MRLDKQLIFLNRLAELFGRLLEPSGGDEAGARAVRLKCFAPTSLVGELRMDNA